MSLNFYRYRTLFIVGLTAGFSPATYADGKLEAQVRAFEAAPSPAAGQIFVTGESDVRSWRTIHRDLAPVTVVGRGLDASSAQQLQNYLDRLVLNYEPRAVLIAAGQSDAERGVASAQIARTHRAIVTHIRSRAPDARIYLLGLKPTPAHWSSWSEWRQTNALLQSFCDQSRQCTYIDVAPAFLTSTGPDLSYYQADGEQLSPAGYDAWADVIRPALLEMLGKIPKAPTALVVE